MDRQTYLALPTSHRVLLLRFVLAVATLRELDQLFISVSMVMSMVPPQDELTTLFCAAGALEVEAAYKQTMRETTKIVRWAHRAGVSDTALQHIYLTYWPERGKLLVPLGSKH